jgi:hypothetical protein
MHTKATGTTTYLYVHTNIIPQSTPFFMIYGREARQLCDQWIHTYADKLKDNTKLKNHQFKYIAKLIQLLDHSWTIAGNKKPAEVEKFNRVPIQHLPFTEYIVGDKCFRRVQPAATYRHFTQAGISSKTRKKNEGQEEEDDRGKKGKSGEKRISSNFQFRWVGPHTITKKFSPVLYQIIVNGKPEVIHAINMQKDPAITALTPYMNRADNITPMRKKQHEYHQDIENMTDILVEDLVDGHGNMRKINDQDEDFEDAKENDVIEGPQENRQIHFRDDNSMIENQEHEERSDSESSISDSSEEDDDDEDDEDYKGR